ncbi:sigma-70 family RNA polymerase sigma factor [Belliella sp. DSM 111904]|uniref:Sigma-70 family RNA polymerase sigma factor n=1 Tax=Belliella filtrata TaxID=2923435 RepID=A0ABS9V0P0_9BACT|nr:sigma-70 family RNA polymerase sigma factor [Belliella filtrata]MCH7409785.1 sigma-70 family RNA polymerase sigma factor [Belliella filtrata]
MPFSKNPKIRQLDVDAEIKQQLELAQKEELGRGGSQCEEEKLWKSFLRGSEAALAEIFLLYADKLYNYGRQFTADRELVNDVVQDVFFTLIKSREKIGVAVSIKFYLYSSFRRRLLRLLKKNRKTVCQDEVNLDHYFQIGMNPHFFHSEESLSQDQVKLIDQAINKLPIRQKEILLLYFFEDLSYKEIAAIMEFSQVKSARKLLYRSLDSLYGHLAEHKEVFRLFYVFALHKMI